MTSDQRLTTHAIVGVVVDDEGVVLRLPISLALAALPALKIPPPRPPGGGLQSGSSQEALLPRTVLWTRVSSPELEIPPPSPLLTPLSAIMLWVRVATPKFTIPPPIGRPGPPAPLLVITLWVTTSLPLLI